VDFLATLYVEGEASYTIEQDDKITNVIVNQKKFILSEEAATEFENIHDDWEATCEKYPYDPLIGGWVTCIFTFIYVRRLILTSCIMFVHFQNTVLSDYITTLKNKQKLDVSSEGPSSRVTTFLMKGLRAKRRVSAYFLRQ
jgi:hypothetical protein